MKNIRQRFSCMANPHAVPTGLSTSSALAGISACLRLLGAMTRPRSEKKRAICESHASCSTSPSPFAVAAARALRSSLVGPSPPFTISTSHCSLRSRRTATSDSRLSPTVLRRVNGNPCSKKRSASQAALVSIICPCSTSSPVDNISTLIIVFSRLFGQNTIAQTRGGEEEKLARQHAAPERLEACAHAHVRTVGQRVVAVAVFTGQVQIAIACFDGDWTHDGPACASVGFLIAVDTA